MPCVYSPAVAPHIAVCVCAQSPAAPAAAAHADAAHASQEQAADDAAESPDDAKLRLRQYEQPGELVTLRSGVQFREILEGSGARAELGSKLSIMYAAPRRCCKR